MAALEAAFLPLEGHFTMPENEETAQVEQETPEAEAAPEAEQKPTDPWADPDAARKEIEKLLGYVAEPEMIHRTNLVVTR